MEQPLLRAGEHMIGSNKHTAPFKAETFRGIAGVSPTVGATAGCAPRLMTTSGSLWGRLVRAVTSLEFLKVVSAVTALLGLLYASLYLAADRIFQVDECYNIRVAYELATQQAGWVAVDLYQYLLSHLVQGGHRSIDWFLQGRFLMVEVFWVNVLLLTLATGARITKPAGLCTLLGAATLTPLWDYGFELRHDNLLLTGLLILWCAVRHGRKNILILILGGAVGVFSLLLATKAAIYVLPLTLALLLSSVREGPARKWRLIVGWVAGGAGTLALLLITYGRSGFFDHYLHGVTGIATMTVDGARFGPWKTLGRLLAQTPLLTAVTVAGLVTLGLEFWRNRKTASLWSSPMPEASLFLVAVVTLCINPTPYPYNLINIVPFMFLFAYRFGTSVLVRLWEKPELRVMIVAVVAFTHFVPFAAATQRHVDRPNGRQESLMSLSEQLSDPIKDPVFDGIGMVPTRPVIAPGVYLHGLSAQRWRTGQGTTMRRLLEKNPPVAVIRSYRTSWLPQQDHDFIASRYVALADDLLVLGKILPQGGGEMQIVHPGRYRIASLQASDVAGTYPEGLAGMKLAMDGPEFQALLDGQPLAAPVVDLDVGTFRIDCNPEIQPTVVWVGPNLDRLPRLRDRDHLDLFVNWY